MKKSVYSVKDIADMAGVSVATVSRVINQNGRFSKETEDRVNEVIRKTNYQPNQLARGLRTSQSKTIGVLVPDITNEFFARIILEIQNRFFAEDYITLIFNTNEDEKVEQQQLNAFQSQQVSGLVYVSGNSNVKPLIKVPTIFIDRKPAFENKEDANYVLIESDNHQGGVLATEELIRKGCRNLACVYFNENLSTHGGRVGGYHEALKTHNLLDSSENLILVDNVSLSESRVKVTELLRRKPEIDGIFCTTDTLAIGAMKAAGDVGLKVPEQIKVVGFDDTSISLHSAPSLTTVRQAVEDFGRITTQCMIEMLTGEQPKKKHYQIPVELIVRHST